MTDEAPTPQDAQTAPPIEEANAMEALLGTIREEMTQQLALLEEEDYDGLLAIGESIAARMQQVTEAKAPLTHVSFEHIQAIHGLHNKITIILSQRCDETGKKLQQIKAGKTVHRAYLDASGT